MRQPRLSHFGRSLLFAGERRDVALNLLRVLKRLDEALTERMARVAQLDELLRHLREEGENDWNALCELIHSGADRRFVLLSPWRAAGLSDRLPVQRNGKILPCAAQSNTIKPPVR